MPRTACYRVSEREGDPALAPAFAAGFLGAAGLVALASLTYLTSVGTIAQMLALALALCLGFVGLSFAQLARRIVLFVFAEEATGITLRMGGGRRFRLPWASVLKLVRARATRDSPVATLHLLCRPRRRLVLPPGEGQDALYDLAVRVLDRKQRSAEGSRPEEARRADGKPLAASGHSPWGVFAWALLKLALTVAGGLFVVLARERAEALEHAFFLAIAFELTVPVWLFPPSATGAVIRAGAGPAGLTYQSLLYGTRTIPWDRLASARVTVIGALGRHALRMLEVYDRDGGRLLFPLPRSREFLRIVDRELGAESARALDGARPSPPGRRRRR